MNEQLPGEPGLIIVKILCVGVVAIFAAWQTGAAELKWMTDLPAAQAEAKAENKLVLLEFTGSDWCPPCRKLEGDIFAKPEFAAYATKELVLVKVDFPNNTKQSEALKAANDALGKKFDVEGFPTLIALRPDGKVAWRTDGYLAGGPAALIKQLEGARKS